jgi:flagellar basal body-associated protein FliL
MMKSKKGLLLLFIVQLILVLSLSVSAADAAPASDVTFTAEASSVVKAGETFTVTITVSDNKGFALAMPKLAYNADVVEFVSASEEGSAFDKNIVEVINNDDSDKVTIVIGDDTKIQEVLQGKAPAITTNGTVATLTFKVKDVATDVQDIFTLDIDKFIIGAGENTVSMVVIVKVVGKNHTHTEAIDAAVPATCTDTGLTEGKHCSYCEEVLTAQTVVPALGHDFATFTSNGDGTHTKVCANDATHTEIENCAGGTATCVDKAVCEACKAAYGEALGHTPGAAATCTEAQTCSVCNVELAPALGHTSVVIPAVDATETTEGSTEGAKCSVCDEILTAPEKTPVIVPEAKSNLWIWIVIIVAVVVVAGAVVAVFVIKKKKSN